MTAACSLCGAQRPIDEFIRVVPRREPWRWRVRCRPSINPGCFRARTLSAADERLEPVTAPAPMYR